MRAKLALALAALSAYASLTASQPANAYDSATYSVQKILGERPRHLLTRALGGYGTRTLPAVIAPGACAAPLALEPVVIRTDYPSDLDIRRLELTSRINSAACFGLLNPGRSSDLKNAMLEVNQAEVAWRASGTNLSNGQSRRLFRSMDKIASDLDYYTNKNSVNLLGFRIVPGGLWF
jgi:hypothetical protein